ncbi:TetR/AcrR family transcriptional regulator [Georgenia yuyongxinii]|uniref:TetR family transcriptional regulator n=1 Tax=Georgenia yuyongxinii TaxID=2589797 RepID=A0A552WN10_9MICO|nr:TetR family transcriptional regulator [Georgenia yuyongxinii]TRW44146.1 TetR family transcriptional regulator [Georgenia yuyongxinii]
MSSARARTDADLTARARIRDAAIRRFATEGMNASLRRVAADAGVSAGLILHHFGSRAGLRTACDEHVLAKIRETKSAVLGTGGGNGGAAGVMLAQLAQVEGYAPLVGYVLRCMQSGGTLAADFVEHLVADAVAYLEEAVAAGTIRPSRGPEARARLLVEQGIGALLLQLPAHQEHLDLRELPGWLRGYMDRIALPLLELYTEPLLMDASLLDAYLATSTPAHPADQSPIRSSS